MSALLRSGLGRLVLLVLLGLLWFNLSFCAGYVLGQYDAAGGNYRLSGLVLQAAERVGFRPGLVTGSGDAALAGDDRSRFRVFWEAWGLVNREFYNRSALDSQKMTYGAVKGMVESLGDPYTAFSTPPEKEVSDSGLRGSFEGIGVQIDQRDGQVQIIAPIDGSPAERAGLRAGDVIQRVDGQELKRRTLNEVVQLIRGPRGTTVTLTIVRVGQPEPLTMPLERAEIKLETVRGKLLNGNLGYVRISSFSATSGADTAATMKSLLEQHPRGFVLDLRSNPGGYLEAAVDIASQFLGNGVVLYQQAAGGARQELRARPGGQATGLPVVVLIDRGSASASEIVAAALHDNGRAALVGEKSYGKGSVQTVHTLSDASGLRVTSAIWLTPSGQPLERQGLDPDLAVAAAAQNGGPDVQLEAAVRYLEASAGGPVEPDRV